MTQSNQNNPAVTSGQVGSAPKAPSSPSPSSVGQAAPVKPVVAPASAKAPAPRAPSANAIPGAGAAGSSNAASVAKAVPGPAAPSASTPKPAEPPAVTSKTVSASAPAVAVVGSPDALEAQESRAVKWIVGAFVAGTMFCVALIVLIVMFWSKSEGKSTVVPTPGAGTNSTPRPTAIVPGRPVRQPNVAVATPARTPRRGRGTIDYSHLPSTTPRLCYAARRHDAESVAKFIAEGDDVNVVSSEGTNAPPVAHATFNENDSAYDVVKILLDHGADPNGATRVRSAFMEAVRHHSPKTAALLLEKGADPTFTNSRGDSAMSVAKTYGDADMVKLVEDAVATWKAGKAKAATVPAVPTGSGVSTTLPTVVGPTPTTNPK
jgi:hypothetical protein